MDENQQVLIDSLPQGKLTADNYRLESAAMPVAGEDEVLVKTIAFSITAGTRAGLQGSASYAGAPKAGRVMNGSGVGEVIESNCADVPVGSRVKAATGWQQYSVHKGSDTELIPESHDPILYLGSLGVSGLTAYFGLLDVGQPRSGETVLVSAAAGSVGHIVGQIAKIKGARVVGVCGSDAKAAMLVSELGFDAAVNYKGDDFRQALKDATPDGVDVYFDNTGGMILGSALFRMNVGGRIACCGVVSQYDTDKPEPGPKGIPGLLINKRVNMQGFLIYDFADRYSQARDELHAWLTSGELKGLTDEVRGLEAAPDAFVDLLGGGNIGTRIVRLD
jgi:NADPH-dependent curcumin reductase CurA